MDMPSHRVGPVLDEEAKRAIAHEDATHRRKLAEIEQTPAAHWAEMLPLESDRHLKRLTRIYADLANRMLERQKA
jgi:hypothetical protein